jgi:uncharacterized glyoxalase superfamily protein PhnB
MAVKPIPDGYHSVTPFLVCNDAASVLEFAKKAFDAKETSEAMKCPEGKIRHAELRIGNSLIMLSEACDETPAMPAMLYLYVENVDKVYELAIKAGARSIKEPADQFYGDRSGGVIDSAGNQWWIGTHIEDVAPEELKKRMQEQMKEKVHAK